jgi:hypothetical protein
VGHACIRNRATAERGGKEIFRYASWCYVDMVEAASCLKPVQVFRDAFGKGIGSGVTDDTFNSWKVPLLWMGDSGLRSILSLVGPGL